MKTITHIEIQRQEGVTNRAFVQRSLSMSEETYNTNVFEMGIVFLNEIYPENDKIYLPLFIDASRSIVFWKWWKAEWHIWEQDLLKFLSDHHVEMMHDMWYQEMLQMAHDDATELSFYNFLKMRNYSL